MQTGGKLGLGIAHEANFTGRRRARGLSTAPREARANGGRWRLSTNEHFLLAIRVRMPLATELRQLEESLLTPGIRTSEEALVGPVLLVRT